MAEEVDMATDRKENDIPGKLASIQDDTPNQNGLDANDEESNGENSTSLNGVSDDLNNGKPTEDMDTEADNPLDKPLENGNAEKAEDLEEIPRSNDTPVVVSDNGDSDVVGSIGNSESPVVVNSDASHDDENSSEAMEIDSKEDDDSNIVELDSNISAPNSDVVEVDHNSSNNPSLISEESSRDSVDSGESIKSGNSSDLKQKDGLVGTVKDDDGDDILITLNDEEEGCKEKEGEDEKNTEEVTDQSKDDEKQSEKEKTEEKDEKVSEEKPKSSVSAENVNIAKTVPVTIQPSRTIAVSSSVPAASLLFQASHSTGQVISSTQSILVQGTLPSIPVGCQLVQQGNQLGYVSVVGNQHIFVPVNNSVPASSAKNPVIASQLTPVQQQQKQKVAQQMKPEDLRPKSSWEMVELMKWEIQNRIPDNYNWSVAFHGRKEELSSVSSFLQELGSDVVKEQVYKDIIQIQTKKKIAGDLKNPEIESLEKMKTVYENTKKKVEHLQLETKECDQCKFKTESSVILSYHNDFPHYDPPWDMNRGWIMCAHCDFKTKTVEHFIFHEKDIHNVQAKFLEKEAYFQCSLCPFNATTKNKLERHQQKCMKHFKLNGNLQPYYHDVNYCMKTCFYKPKKIIPKPPPPKPVVSKPSMLTRQQGTVPVTQTVVQQNQAIRPNTNIAIRQRLPVMRSPMPPQNVQRPQMPQPRPRLTPPTLQRAPVQQQKPVRPPGREMSGFEVCELCGGYVKDRQALRIHFYYAHKVEMPQAIFSRPQPPLTCDVCKSHYWTTQGLTKHKTAQRHFIGSKSPAVSGKITTEMECFMCMKRFPNLFVHFERVHGMTMKDLVQVRKCIMCGLATNDYKSLESHLVNTHGILIKVNDYLNDKTKPMKPSPSSAVTSGGKNVGKINYCVFCQIQFPDNIQLTMHCIKIHATCRTCGMVVATNKHLADHSCRKAHINRSCYICGTKVTSQEKYALHLRSHVKPCRVKIENLTADEVIEAKEKIKREYKPAVISLDSDEDSDVEVVETKPSKIKVVLEKDEENDVEMVDLSEEVDEKSNDNKSENDSKIKKKTDTNKEEIQKETDTNKEEIQKETDTNKEKTEMKKESDVDIKNDCSDSSNTKDTEQVKEESGDESVSTEQVKEESGDESVSTAAVEKDSSIVESKVESEDALKEKENLDANMEGEMLKDNNVVKEEQGLETDSDSVLKEKIDEFGKEMDKSKDTAVKSEAAGSETDQFKDEKETLNESKKNDVESRELNHADPNENEVELEDRLLGKYDDEDSVMSSESRKRKKSESDIDEDELLKDDDANVKRIKIESESNDYDKSADKNDAKDKTEMLENDDKSMNDVEMVKKSSASDIKTEET